MSAPTSNARVIAELRLAALAFRLGYAGQSKPTHTDTGVTLIIPTTRAEAAPKRSAA